MSVDLHKFLKSWAGEDSPKLDIAHAITALAGVSIRLSETIALGRISGPMDAIVGDNADGDAQKELDVRAHDLFTYALRYAPVSAIISEESDDAIWLNKEKPLTIGIDPLDGSSNVDTNVSIGTIFSIWPTPEAADEDDDISLLTNGRNQCAAGFIIYGPQTAFVLSVGDGVVIFTLDRAIGRFIQTFESVTLPERKQEYAINASNYRHWDEPVRAYIDECISGVDGPRGENYNMRWIASLVAETYRIMVRGGIFLYPSDDREGYQNGRLRLVYEANPIAYLIEQAKGGASNGAEPILEIEPTALHQRTALVFGSLRMVERVARYHNQPEKISDHAPLFGARSLFR